MKGVKYLSVLFVGTLVYVLLSVTVGQNSFKSYKRMEEQKRIVSKQKADIQNINSELSLELMALKSDKAVIAAYARKLGYVNDGEKIVKINGLKPYQNALYDTGTVVRHEEPEYISERFCKLSSFIVAFLWLIILFFYDLNKGNISLKRKEKTMVTGVPIYDLPQI